MKRKKTMLDLFENETPVAVEEPVVKENPVVEVAKAEEVLEDVGSNPLIIKEKQYKLMAFRRGGLGRYKQVLLKGSLEECQKEKIKLEKAYKADKTICLRIK